MWETLEVQTSLHEMYLAARAENTEAGSDDDELPADDAVDPAWCHDKDKPRVTMEQYTAFKCVQVGPLDECN